MKHFFESFLWNSRLVVLVAVIASLATGMAVFYLVTVDVGFLILRLGEYTSSALTVRAREALRAEMIAHAVEILDGYLLATAMLIFAIGLYELFIRKIEQAEKSERVSHVLFIENLDDLKARLKKVLLMMLIVKFFKHALEMHFTSALDLLAFAGGIALIGLVLSFSPEDVRKSHKHKGLKNYVGSI